MVAVPVELTDGRAVLPVHDASPIVIESEAGVIQAYAREDDSLPTGTVSMSHAWGALIGDDPGEAGTFAGRLVSLTHSRQTINYMPRLSAIPIRVNKPST